MAENLLIGIVGPCASGKTTLVKALEEVGYQARHIAQEHSYVADMWQRMTNPNCLIYLDVSYQEAMNRRPQQCTEVDYKKQRQRLIHARQHANLYIQTDHLQPDAILSEVLQFIQEQST